MSGMIKQLEQAVEKVKKLSKERQEYAARCSSKSLQLTIVSMP